MIFKLLLIGAALIPSVANPQETANNAPLLSTLSELEHLPWPHIGSPPVEDCAASRTGQWRSESTIFFQRHEIIKRSWTDRAPASPMELRERVRKYEELVASATASEGYGNLLLADSLKRLSITVLLDYAMAHPSEYAVLDELLKANRSRLLDSQATKTTLTEELNLTPPEGAWHLAESRQEIELAFRATGSTYENEISRMFVGVPTISDLMHRRDVYALLLRVIESETLERVHLPGLIEFRKLGGRLEDLQPNDVRPYLRVMEGSMRRFRFAPLGINMLRQEHLVELMAGFDPRGKKPNRFTARALE